MKIILNAVLLILFALIHSTFVRAQGLVILSWNIQDCGQTKSDDEILAIARIVRDADIVAIQEVVAKHPGGAQSIGRLGDALNRMGAKWEYRISDPTNSPSPYSSERYAFLYKSSVVEMVGRPFLDSVLAPLCDREPFLARFRCKANGKGFLLVNFHSRRFDEHPEEEVKHFVSYPDRFNDPVIIAGDFNMNEDHPVFSLLYKLGYHPAVRNQKSTLKRECSNGYYLNHAIDNIYLPAQLTSKAGGAIDFVGDCSHLLSARQLSDHLPVFCTFSF